MKPDLNLRQVDPGFNPGGAVAFTVNASGLGLAPPALPVYFAGLHDRVAALPQVGQVSLAQMGLPTEGRTTGTGASGEIRVASPRRSSSSMKSPSTPTVCLLNLPRTLANGF